MLAHAKESFEQIQKRLIAGLVKDIKTGAVGVGSPVLKHIIIDNHERQQDSEVEQS
jgi:hypothetical protein